MKVAVNRRGGSSLIDIFFARNSVSGRFLLIFCHNFNKITLLIRKDFKMRCEVINTKDKCFIIFRNGADYSVKVITSKIASVYNAYSDMPVAEYNELLAAKKERVTKRMVR